MQALAYTGSAVASRLRSEPPSSSVTVTVRVDDGPTKVVGVSVTVERSTCKIVEVAVAELRLVLVDASVEYEVTVTMLMGC